jgi:peptide/nickel transport system permease protein
MRRRAVHSLATILIAVLAGGLTAATLVRLAPGFGVDEREFDSRFGAEAVRRIRAETNGSRESALKYYMHYLARAATGDLGFSTSFRRPVAALIAERLPQTARAAGMGLAAAWALGMLLAFAAVMVAQPAFDMASGALAALLLCLPASVVALGFVVAGRMEGPLAAAGVIALVIFPRVFRYARAILGRFATAPHVLMARAKGLGRLRVMAAHMLVPAAGSILALLGVSASLAFGAAIPAEVICDSPGLGQLAWQAALKRDLPLLIDITALVTVLAGIAGLAAEVVHAPSAAGKAS